MERLISVILLSFLALPVCAAELPAAKPSKTNNPPLFTPPVARYSTAPVSYSICNKNFNMPTEKLFYMAIASANANKFRINEIQSKNGYILFTAANNDFLATVIKLDKTRSVLKITPADNNYYFPQGIVSNFFKYIETNASEEVKVLPKKG